MLCRRGPGRASTASTLVAVEYRGFEQWLWRRQPVFSGATKNLSFHSAERPSPASSLFSHSDYPHLRMQLLPSKYGLPNDDRTLLFLTQVADGATIRFQLGGPQSSDQLLSEIVVPAQGAGNFLVFHGSTSNAEVAGIHSVFMVLTGAGSVGAVVDSFWFLQS